MAAPGSRPAVKSPVGRVGVLPGGDVPPHWRVPVQCEVIRCEESRWGEARWEVPCCEESIRLVPSSERPRCEESRCEEPDSGVNGVSGVNGGERPAGQRPDAPSDPEAAAIPAGGDARRDLAMAAEAAAVAAAAAVGRGGLAEGRPQAVWGRAPAAVNGEPRSAVN
eukprot:scaffold18244_cov105-Isochrysis_galbana.AAC.1